MADAKASIVSPVKLPDVPSVTVHESDVANVLILTVVPAGLLENTWAIIEKWTLTPPRGRANPAD